MEIQIYTVHHKPARPLRVVEDRFRPLAVFLPPLWAAIEGCWLTVIMQAVVLGLAWLWSPVAVAPVFYGVAFFHGWEGGAVIRWELKLRGWREVGTVEARSAEGAEEMFLKGEAA